MKWLKRAARWLVGDFEWYRIYARSTTDCPEPVATGAVLAPLEDSTAELTAEDPAVRQLAQAGGGPEAFGFGAWVNGRLVGGCWVWAGERYKRRGFIRLAPDEAKLVQITVAEKYRGRGLAPELLRYATCRVGERGYRRLLARIWHSHTSSLSAFEKAGWEYLYTVLVIFPFRVKRPVRFVYRHPSSRKRCQDPVRVI